MHHTSHRPVLRRGLVAALVAAGLSTAGLATAGSATAASDGATAEVCAQTVYLRDAPAPDATYTGTMSEGEHVLVHSHPGNGMVYVFAYGHVNRNGYLLESALC